MALIHTDLLAFGIALLATLGLTVPVRSLALHYGLVDHPGPRKVHLKPIPLLGGIAIYLGFVLAILLTLHNVPRQQIASIVAGATLVATVGFLDDRGLLHHQVKLFVGMPVAALILARVRNPRAVFFAIHWRNGGRDSRRRASRFSGSWASPRHSAFSITWMASARESRL